jgi:hypothetical protein
MFFYCLEETSSYCPPWSIMLSAEGYLLRGISEVRLFLAELKFSLYGDFCISLISMLLLWDSRSEEW